MISLNRFFKNFGLLEILVLSSLSYVIIMLLWTASTRSAVEEKANLIKSNHKKVVNLICHFAYFSFGVDWLTNYSSHSDTRDLFIYFKSPVCVDRVEKRQSLTKWRSILISIPATHIYLLNTLTNKDSNWYRTIMLSKITGPILEVTSKILRATGQGMDKIGRAIEVNGYTERCKRIY